MRVTIELSTGGRNAIVKLDNLYKVKIPNASKLVSYTTAHKMKRMAQDFVDTNAKFHGKAPGTLSSGISVKPGVFGRIKKQYYVNASAISGGHDYASDVEYGTKPHIIRMPVGSHGDKLAMGWSGNSPKRRYGGYRTHIHPGSKGMFFMKHAFDWIVKGHEGFDIFEQYATMR